MPDRQFPLPGRLPLWWCASLTALVQKERHSRAAPRWSQFSADWDTAVAHADLPYLEAGRQIRRVQLYKSEARRTQKGTQVEIMLHLPVSRYQTTCHHTTPHPAPDSWHQQQQPPPHTHKHTVDRSCCLIEPCGSIIICFDMKVMRNVQSQTQNPHT